MTVPAATTTVIGGVKKAATVANCTVAADGTSAGTQLNALLASLRAAGIIV
ncbi:head fiber protein [Yersinia enterocolitica]|uniref:head fiber protein n=1 Tax=Yersinia enterocolitica TaxID=630 RepID=UPI001CA48E15|nr:head fiber protein [Yersinia enterocolitica]